MAGSKFGIYKPELVSCVDSLRIQDQISLTAGGSVSQFFRTIYVAGFTYEKTCLYKRFQSIKFQLLAFPNDSLPFLSARMTSHMYFYFVLHAYLKTTHVYHSIALEY